MTITAATPQPVVDAVGHLAAAQELMARAEAERHGDPQRACDFYGRAMRHMVEALKATLSVVAP